MVQTPKDIPHTPGVYVFKKGKTPLYVGKAANLKKRLSSYFRATAGDKVRRLRTEATTLEWIQTSSEIEAFIREAELIKRHLPKFNILLRDDKSYFYVAVTREKFPRIFIVHQPRIEPRVNTHESRTRKSHNSKFIIHNSRFIGPFTSGSALRATLKFLRRAFPYCTCTTPHKRPCLNSQIGRCPGYCCMNGSQKFLAGQAGIRNCEEYGKDIKNIIAVLTGKKKRLLSALKQEMRQASKEEDYENAAKLRDQVQSIENIFEHRSILEKSGRSLRTSRAWPPIEIEIKQILKTDHRISRVEGYDISNISGTEATGSMVVFINGKPTKREYKKFKIKTIREANDTAMHREVMRRRIMHPEWGMPDLILIDGGKPQLNAVIQELGIRNQELRVKIAALAKREEELYIEGEPTPVRLDSLSQGAMLFFQHVRDESHRFAKKYHHKLREIAYRIQ